MDVSIIFMVLVNVTDLWHESDEVIFLVTDSVGGKLDSCILKWMSG